jgi:hypothetical protein
MTRFILLTIIIFIALTFLMTFLKGVLRRAMSTHIHNSFNNQEQKTTRPAKSTAQEEIYRKNGVVVLQGDAPRAEKE